MNNDTNKMKTEENSSIEMKFKQLAHRLGISRLIRGLHKEARDLGWSFRFRRDAIELKAGDLTVLFRNKSVYYLAIFIRHYSGMLERLVPQERAGELVLLAFEEVLFRLRSGDVICMLEYPECTDPFGGYIARGEPRRGDVVLDAGAFCGECTIEFARMVGDSGHVFALEPDPLSRQMILDNLKKNNVSNVTVLPFVIWNLNEELSFEVAGSCASSIVGFNTNNEKDVPIMLVDARTPAEIFKIMGKTPDFIKMDIEGAELEVIKPLIPHLVESGKPCRMAIASYHIREGKPTHELITPDLVAAGFVVETGNPSHTTTWAHLD